MEYAEFRLSAITQLATSAKDLLPKNQRFMRKGHIQSAENGVGKVAKTGQHGENPVKVFPI